MNNGQVHVVEDLNEFLSLKEEWDALVAAMEHPMPFFTHAWVRLWWDSFHEGRSLYIMTVRNEGRLKGILPLLRMRCRTLKVFSLPCFHSLTNGHSLACNFISAPGDLKEVLNAFKTHLVNNNHDWSMIVLGYIPTDFTIPSEVSQCFNNSGMCSFLEPRDGAYYIDIQGDFETFYCKLNASFRDNRKNIANRMARLGRVTFEVVKDYDQKAVQQFYDLEDTGWKREGAITIKSSAELARFYNNISQVFSGKHQFLLATLRVNGGAIASIYGIVFERTFYFLKLGVNYSNPEYKKFSPGQAILYELIRYCFEQKMKRFDFYGACYPFEAHWTKTINRRATVLIFNRRNFLANICISLKKAQKVFNTLIN
ncbi:MAG: GNAT family N-acetyltransferase [Candidatus Omnitrophica bacterium]|nr:GNAT family N-acetyltransferase [Candidatus Omnitrophota bacterium]